MPVRAGEGLAGIESGDGDDDADEPEQIEQTRDADGLDLGLVQFDVFLFLVAVGPGVPEIVDRQQQTQHEQPWLP